MPRDGHPPTPGMSHSQKKLGVEVRSPKNPEWTKPRARGNGRSWDGTGFNFHGRKIPEVCEETREDPCSSSGSLNLWWIPEAMEDP